MNLRHSSSPYGKFTWRVAALALAVATLGACSDDPEPTAPPEEIDIALSESSITLVRSRNQTATISAEVTGTTNQGVTWTVHNPDIATVSQTGLITPVADGQTFVTVRSEAEPSVNRSVVVNVVSTIVTTTPTSMWSWVGGPTRQLAVAVENNDNTAVTWHTTNAAVATVDQDGVVTPVGTGSAEIYAQSVAQTEKRGITNFTVDPAPQAGFTELTSGSSVTLSAAAGNNAYYWIAVPPGSTNFTAAIAGAGGQDADIYVYRADASLTAMENLSSAGRLCNPWLAGSTETCTFSNPQPRIYYVIVNAYTGYSDVTLTTTTTP